MTDHRTRFPNLHKRLVDDEPDEVFSPEDAARLAEYFEPKGKPTPLHYSLFIAFLCIVWVGIGVFLWRFLE